jgi:excisionase family DNA binding protein
MTAAAAKQPRHIPLPLSLPPRGLRREEAAAYIGVSASTFDKMIAEGRMPKPKRFGDRTIWDRHALDQAFEMLDGGELAEPVKVNPWDAMSNV